MRPALWLGAEARGAQQLDIVDLDMDGYGEQDREMGETRDDARIDDGDAVLRLFHQNGKNSSIRSRWELERSESSQLDPRDTREGRSQW